jgi:hypothetical protein
MIRADVNMTGAIKRSATTRTDKNENPYLSFVVKVNLPDAKGKGRDLEVLVTYKGGKKSDLSLFTEGKRVTVQGTLDIRKKGEDLAFYLTASKVSTKNVPDDDGITGELHFRGRLKNDNICEEKSDRHGNPYLLFSAYSSEKVGENFVSTWVRFLRFPEKGASVETIKPEWMKPKARVSIDGELQLGVYDQQVRLSCRVSDMKEYIKEEYQNK